MLELEMMNQKVDTYISNAAKWQNELETLRSIILDCQLTEEFKWRNPCYTYRNSNVLIIGAFKEYCALSFFKGVLLNNSDNILVAPGENSQSVRLLKFTNVNEIVEQKATLKAYIFEAIEIERAGLKVQFNKNIVLKYPEELQNKLNEMPDLKTAFEGLTPGRQKAYVLFFTAAKQSKTRVTRIEKYIPRILMGKGINDCVCGLSKRLPSCDGSHKFI
ncbi:MAG: YdeI/OmpD-associated family protein [Prolixibacteraceae bacterium]|jgi:uncharacterized protein YdeI (YjbR/CyaY-like superfamily)|nr:YdeI/OmpD-associated family protein [Prolixibacteraceae bacterium]